MPNYVKRYRCSNCNAYMWNTFDDPICNTCGHVHRFLLRDDPNIEIGYWKGYWKFWYLIPVRKYHWIPHSEY